MHANRAQILRAIGRAPNEKQTCHQKPTKQDKSRDAHTSVRCTCLTRTCSARSEPTTARSGRKLVWELFLFQCSFIAIVISKFGSNGRLHCANVIACVLLTLNVFVLCLGLHRRASCWIRALVEEMHSFCVLFLRCAISLQQLQALSLVEFPLHQCPPHLLRQRLQLPVAQVQRPVTSL